MTAIYIFHYSDVKFFFLNNPLSNTLRAPANQIVNFFFFANAVGYPKVVQPSIEALVISPHV